MTARNESPAYRHPVNVATIGEATLGDRTAHRMTAFLGSWRFLTVQTAIVAALTALSKEPKH